MRGRAAEMATGHLADRTAKSPAEAAMEHPADLLTWRPGG